MTYLQKTLAALSAGPADSRTLASLVGTSPWKIASVMSLAERKGLVRHVQDHRSKRKRFIWHLPDQQPPKPPPKAAGATTFAEWWPTTHFGRDLELTEDRAKWIWDCAVESVTGMFERRGEELRGKALYHPEHTIAAWVKELRGEEPS